MRALMLLLVGSAVTLRGGFAVRMGSGKILVVVEPNLTGTSQPMLNFWSYVSAAVPFRHYRGFHRVLLAAGVIALEKWHISKRIW